MSERIDDIEWFSSLFKTLTTGTILKPLEVGDQAVRDLYYSNQKRFDVIYADTALAYHYRITMPLPIVTNREARAVIRSFKQAESQIKMIVIDYTSDSNMSEGRMVHSFSRAFTSMKRKSDLENRLLELLARHEKNIYVHRQHELLEAMRFLLGGSAIELNRNSTSEADASAAGDTLLPIASNNDQTLDGTDVLEIEDIELDPSDTSLSTIEYDPGDIEKIVEQERTHEEPHATFNEEEEEEEEEESQALEPTQETTLPGATSVFTDRRKWSIDQQVHVTLDDLEILSKLTIAMLNYRLLTTDECDRLQLSLAGSKIHLLKNLVYSDVSQDFFDSIIALLTPIERAEITSQLVCIPIDGKPIEAVTRFFEFIALVHSCNQMHVATESMQAHELRTLMPHVRLDLRHLPWRLCPTPHFYGMVFDLDHVFAHHAALSHESLDKCFDYSMMRLVATTDASTIKKSVHFVRHCLEHALRNNQEIDDNVGVRTAVSALEHLDRSTRLWLDIEMHSKLALCYDLTGQHDMEKVAGALERHHITIEQLAALVFVVAADVAESNTKHTSATDVSAPISGALLERDYRAHQFMRGIHLTTDMLLDRKIVEARNNQHWPALTRSQLHMFKEALTLPPRLSAFKRSFAALSRYFYMMSRSGAHITVVQVIKAMVDDGTIDEVHSLQHRMDLQAVLYWLRAIVPYWSSVHEAFVSMSRRSGSVPYKSLSDAHNLWNRVLEPILQNYSEVHSRNLHGRPDAVLDFHMFDQCSARYTTQNGMMFDDAQQIVHLFDVILSGELNHVVTYETSLRSSRGAMIRVASGLAYVYHHKYQHLIDRSMRSGSDFDVSSAWHYRDFLRDLNLTTMVLSALQMVRHDSVRYTGDQYIDRLFPLLKIHQSHLLAQWRLHGSSVQRSVDAAHRDLASHQRLAKLVHFRGERTDAPRYGEQRVPPVQYGKRSATVIRPLT